MKLPPHLADLPQPLYFFDGYCVLCSGFADFCLKHDGDGRLRFATTQSLLGQDVVQALGLPPGTLDRTILLLEDDRAFLRSSAALRSLRHLKGWPRCLEPLRAIPAFVRDPIYDLVARNRYRWFGTPAKLSPADAANPRPVYRSLERNVVVELGLAARRGTTAAARCRSHCAAAHFVVHAAAHPAPMPAPSPPPERPSSMVSWPPKRGMTTSVV